MIRACCCLEVCSSSKELWSIHYLDIYIAVRCSLRGNITTYYRDHLYKILLWVYAQTKTYMSIKICYKSDIEWVLAY